MADTAGADAAGPERDGGREDATMVHVDATADLADSASAEASADAGDATPGGDDAVLGDGAVVDRAVDAGGPPQNRGVASLALGAHELQLAVLEAGLVRVRYQPRGLEIPERGWTTVPLEEPTAALALEEGDGWRRVRTSELELRLEPASGRILISDLSGNVLSQDMGLALEASATAIHKALAPADHFYGFGEKTGPLDKRGQRMEMWTTDPWWPEPAFTPSSDPIYQAIPFYIVLRDGQAHGVYVASTVRSRFDVGVSAADRVTLQVEAPSLTYYFIYGPSVARVLERWTALSGRPPLPPLWALGYQQCRWSYAPEAEVRRVVQGFLDRGIPLDGIWLDIDYMDGFRSFTWDPAGFPDPRGLVEDLEALGVATTVIIDPGIKHQPEGGYPVFDTAREGGHLVTTPDGAPFVGQVWPGAAVFPDFTSAATRSWWSDQVAALLASGVRGVWIDMNEPTTWQEGGFPLDTRFAGEGTPTDHREARNVYALLMARATHAGMLQGAPDRRPFVLTRAGFAGIQRHAAVWTGDARSEWSHLQMAPAMLMNLGLSGVALVGSDVGGFSGSPGPELFARWLQLGTVSPFFRTHVMSGAPRQEPWSFGPEVEAISRAHIALRYRLLPYLYELVRDSHLTGAPVLRPLLYDAQDDPATYDIDDVFMLGPQLLVAPVLEPGSVERQVYLPRGVWVDYYSAAVSQGPATVTVAAPLYRLPLWARGNAILHAGDGAHNVGELPREQLVVDLYPAAAPPQSTRLGIDDFTSQAYLDGVTWHQDWTLEGSAEGFNLRVAPEQGTYQAPHRWLLVRAHGVASRPAEVLANGAALPEVSDPAALASGRGWHHAPASHVLTMSVQRDEAGGEIAVRYGEDPAGARVVSLLVEAELPESTPAGQTVYLAAEQYGWEPDAVPMERVGTRARATVQVGEGQGLLFKLTRGSWDSVEKGSDCEELPNHELLVLGDAAARLSHGLRVERWLDLDCR